MARLSCSHLGSIGFSHGALTGSPHTRILQPPCRLTLRLCAPIQRRTRMLTCQAALSQTCPPALPGQEVLRHPADRPLLLPAALVGWSSPRWASPASCSRSRWRPSSGCWAAMTCRSEGGAAGPRGGSTAQHRPPLRATRRRGGVRDGLTPPPCLPHTGCCPAPRLLAHGCSSKEPGRASPATTDIVRT